MLKRALDTFRMWIGLGYLGLICALWVPVALVLQPLLPKRIGRPFGRRMITFGFRSYLGWLALIRACRFDVSELASLREAGPLILAPNHPCLLDAVMIIAYLPDVACIMKAGLMRNWLFGAAARLACYIRNDSPLEMTQSAVQNLRDGSQLLVFPEGTRTTQWPLNPCKGSVALIAQRAQTPVQTLIIETDSLYLSKGWPLFRRPAQPIHYRIRLGRRFDPPRDIPAFTQALEDYFRTELPPTSPARPAPPQAPLSVQTQTP